LLNEKKLYQYYSLKEIAKYFIYLGIASLIIIKFYKPLLDMLMIKNELNQQKVSNRGFNQHFKGYGKGIN
jgi:hypothetical protein